MAKNTLRYINDVYINISHHSKTLLFSKHERYLGVTRRAIYSPREHRKHRHDPLLIRVLSIKWTNKKSEARTDTLEETTSSAAKYVRS